MQIIDLNHVAVTVSDLAKSIYFYNKQLGLPLLDRPNFDFDGAWLSIGKYQELHLISRDPAVDNKAPRDHHFAIQVKSIEEAELLLNAEGIRHEEKKKRPDGAWQIFLRDPDGYFIEICQLN